LALVAFVHHAFGLPRTGIGLKKQRKFKDTFDKRKSLRKV
jgi:hypothetical protein